MQTRISFYRGGMGDGSRNATIAAGISVSSGIVARTEMTTGSLGRV